ncbi:MAG: hypothetical protein J0I12_01910 [Candidatus Eremiobacteraeota bacterium]|nr:hypothetical protein [Candidatus Eremiobacteraeota bacterium]
MKKTVLMLLLGLGGLAWAEPDKKDTGKKEPIMMRLQAVQVSDAVAQDWDGDWRLKAADLQEDGVRVLQTTEVVGMTGRECSVFVGRKNHIVYYDARATQFQIQYVDVGAKLNCQCKLVGDRITAQVYTELSSLEKNVNDGKASFPQTLTLNAHADTPGFVYGDRVLVGTVHGVEARHYLEVLGGSPSAKNDNVYFILTVERL